MVLTRDGSPRSLIVQIRFPGHDIHHCDVFYRSFLVFGILEDLMFISRVAIVGEQESDRQSAMAYSF